MNCVDTKQISAVYCSVVTITSNNAIIMHVHEYIYTCSQCSPGSYASLVFPRPLNITYRILFLTALKYYYTDELTRRHWRDIKKKKTFIQSILPLQVKMEESNRKLSRSKMNTKQPAKSGRQANTMGRNYRGIIMNASFCVCVCVCSVTLAGFAANYSVRHTGHSPLLPTQS